MKTEPLPADLAATLRRMSGEDRDVSSALAPSEPACPAPVVGSGGVVGLASELIKSIEAGDHIKSYSLYSEWLLSGDIGSLKVRQAADHLLWTLYHRNHRKDLTDAVRWAVNLGLSSVETDSEPNIPVSGDGAKHRRSL